MFENPLWLSLVFQFHRNGAKRTTDRQSTCKNERPERPLQRG
jgi:hypothetical protein